MSDRPSSLPVPAAIVLGACIIAFGLYAGLKAQSPASPAPTATTPTPSTPTPEPTPGGPCVPLKACPSAMQCDSIPDGCGGVLPCGSCPAGKTCRNGTCG